TRWPPRRGPYLPACLSEEASEAACPTKEIRMLLALLLASAPAAAPVETDLFTAGKEGYHTFRIPALVATPKGSLLAFCEGRKRGRGDSGDIDVVLRRSRDRGKTWLPLQLL